jgi:peptide chain release factor 2
MEEQQKLEDTKTDVGWGHQIRSYVMQPYQLVKDLRTGTQSSDPQGVLDGDLDTFLETALAQKMSGVGPAKVEDLD